MAAVNQEIPDKQHIRELQNRYSYAIDSGQYGNLDAMFTPNATDHFVTGSTDNIEALKKTIQDALQPLSSSQHINGNQWAEIEGDRATAASMFVSNHPPSVPRLFLVFGTLYNRRAGQKAPAIPYYHSMVAEIASN